MELPIFESTVEPTHYAGFYRFRVGTCNGLWQSTEDAYQILSVINHQKGNGHFKATMQWFEQSCRRDNKKLQVLECWNLRLASMLRKHGFKRYSGLNYEKTFV
jgi:hypothetical protein